MKTEDTFGEDRCKVRRDKRSPVTSLMMMMMMIMMMMMMTTMMVNDDDELVCWTYFPKILSIFQYLQKPVIQCSVQYLNFHKSQQQHQHQHHHQQQQHEADHKKHLCNELLVTKPAHQSVEYCTSFLKYPKLSQFVVVISRFTQELI